VCKLYPSTRCSSCADTSLDTSSGDGRGVTTPAPKSDRRRHDGSHHPLGHRCQRVDLYLQPMVTLAAAQDPYYEALSRLAPTRATWCWQRISSARGRARPAAPDRQFVIFRCVQVVRRLLAKNREIGLFCNVSGSTLTDGSVFHSCLSSSRANRAVSSSIVLEISQSALTSAGPIELESLSALAERGYRFLARQRHRPAVRAA